METLLKPRLTVHPKAVQANYAEIRRHAPDAEICPVVKSQAYGLRAVEIVRTLIAVGCRNFYVSTLSEGMELRDKFSDIQINVLNGLQEGMERVSPDARYQQHRATETLGRDIAERSNGLRFEYRNGL